MKQIVSFSIFYVLFSIYSIGQTNIIELKNPSFEQTARAGKTPYNWMDCGFTGETPPDIQPGHFGVSVPSFDGETYLGLVTRDNDTWERISQQLSAPLLGEQCYQFSLYINRSKVYLSASQINNSLVNYIEPIVLRIWGGNQDCAKIEKLAESKPNTSSDWEQHTFIFRPKKNHTHLLLEAFYQSPVLYSYNGHILLDNASPIIQLNCESTANIETSAKDFISSPTISSETSTTSEINAPTDNGIYHIPSMLDSKKMDQLINKIHIYLSTNSKYAAEIYIEDENLKATKITKQLIIDRLSRRGWKNEKDYTIFKERR